MKFDVAFERVYPHSLDAVWRAITDAKALGQWLMETDFVAEEGREFKMWCENSDGSKDLYLCKVISIEPKVLMRWSWILNSRQTEGATYVELELSELADGTRLIIRHSGDRDPAIIEAFKSGWPYKLESLESLLLDLEQSFG